MRKKIIKNDTIFNHSVNSPLESVTYTPFLWRAKSDFITVCSIIILCFDYNTIFLIIILSFHYNTIF